MNKVEAELGKKFFTFFKEQREGRRLSTFLPF